MYFLNFTFDENQPVDAEVNDEIREWICSLDTVETRRWMAEIDNEWLLSLFAQNLAIADDEDLENLTENEVLWTVYGCELIGEDVQETVKAQARELGLRIG